METNFYNAIVASFLLVYMMCALDFEYYILSDTYVIIIYLSLYSSFVVSNKNDWFNALLLYMGF